MRIPMFQRDCLPGALRPKPAGPTTFIRVLVDAELLDAWYCKDLQVQATVVQRPRQGANAGRLIERA